MFMFQHILGLIIDPDGNYLSFGKLDDIDNDKDNAYLYLHGRAFMSQIYFHHWHKTHLDLNLQDFNFQNIFLYESEKTIDYEIYYYFQRLSQLGYVILINGSKVDESPIIIGYIPKNFTNSQALTLYSLKDYIELDQVSFSEIYKSNAEGEIITLRELFEEIEKQVLKRRTLE